MVVSVKRTMRPVTSQYATSSISQHKVEMLQTTRQVPTSESYHNHHLYVDRTLLHVTAKQSSHSREVFKKP